MARFLLLLLFTAPRLYADFELNASINDIFYRGSHELLGSINLVVDGNDFEGASPQQPRYLAYNIDEDRNVVLAHTLVDLNSENATENKPIYLAVRAMDTGLINVPEDAVSIVRWKAGERVIWVKVQADSSTWLSDDQDNTFAPSGNNRVSWTIGTSARRSFEENGNNANLPFNTTVTSPSGESDAYSTLLCVDLNESTIPTSGIQSLVWTLVTLYEADAEVSPGVFQPGTVPNGCCDAFNYVGRSVDRGLSVDLERKPAGDSVNLAEADGLLSLASNWDLYLSSSDEDPPEMLAGSFLVLSLEPGSGYGFDTQATSLTDACNDRVSTLFGNTFQIGGRTVAEQALFIWNGPEQDLSRFLTQLSGTMHSIPGNTGNPGVTWELFLVISDHDPADTAPFDASYQWRRCLPGAAKVGYGSADLGGGEERVLAHITDAEGSFTTQLDLSNASINTAAYLVRGYDIDGNLIGYVTGSLPAGGRTTMNAVDFMNNPALSHLTIANGSKISVTAAYQAKGEDKSPVHVAETTGLSKRWLIYAGNPRLTYDGFALVNMSNDPLQGFISEYDADDNLIGTMEFVNALPPRAKQLLVLQQQDNRPGTYFIIETSQSSVIMALRGDLASNFVWENQAVSLEN
ncbi:MAG: hypothetical protein QNK37_07600 [Acidobacteriota bacterium]|nr:hypothetical protein [Acidobacteriota bacterium]